MKKFKKCFIVLIVLCFKAYAENAEPNSPSYTCPEGKHIDKSSVEINYVDISNKVTCVANSGSIIYPEVNCIATNPIRDPIIYSNELNTGQSNLYRTITIPPTRWAQWCGYPIHPGCNEGYNEISDTQDTIKSIKCTNDFAKTEIGVQR